LNKLFKKTFTNEKVTIQNFVFKKRLANDTILLVFWKKIFIHYPGPYPIQKSNRVSISN